jgi:phosphate transport system substrate-binding protein
MRPTSLAFCAVLVALHPACKREQPPIEYEGSSTIGLGVMPELTDAFARETGIKFTRVGTAGSSEGFKAVMAGKVPLGGMSRRLTPAERAQSPYFQIIGYDALVVFVNQKNPVRDVSMKQLKSIFAGRIRNWKEVGGEDAPIEVASEPKNSPHGTFELFKAAVLGDEEIKATRELDQPLDCVKLVATDPHGITFAARAFNQPGTVTLSVEGSSASREAVLGGGYPISRPLLLLSKDTPEGSTKRFFEYALSPAGQKIVATKFVAVH